MGRKKLHTAGRRLGAHDKRGRTESTEGETEDWRTPALEKNQQEQPQDPKGRKRTEGKKNLEGFDLGR